MRRWCSLFIITLAIAGCASTSSLIQDPLPASAAELHRLAALVAGDYVAIRRADEAGEANFLQVVSENHAQGARLLMTQRRGAVERHFLLELQATATAHRLDGRFIPLQEQRGAHALACDMRFVVTSGRLLGETAPGDCRFQAGDQFVDLLKAIAFEDNRISIVDQVLAEDGSPLTEPDRLVMGRVAEFEGQVARQDGSVWRSAPLLRLTSGGHLVEPLDPAGMPLGLLLNLELVFSAELGLPALRLQILDEPTGRVRAEVASPMDSGVLSLKMDGLQVQLWRFGSRPPLP